MCEKERGLGGGDPMSQSRGVEDTGMGTPGGITWTVCREPGDESRREGWKCQPGSGGLSGPDSYWDKDQPPSRASAARGGVLGGGWAPCPCFSPVLPDVSHSGSRGRNQTAFRKLRRRHGHSAPYVPRWPSFNQYAEHGWLDPFLPRESLVKMGLCHHLRMGRVISR